MVNDIGTFQSKLGLVEIKGELSLCSHYRLVCVNHLRPVNPFPNKPGFYVSAVQVF